MTERPRQSIIIVDRGQELRDPILVSGLPGIGFIGNIAIVHMIRILRAEKFGEVYSPYFQDAAYSSVEGSIRRPTIELHVRHHLENGRDLILLYGNTQPLTSYGQYEVSEKILDEMIKLGCKTVATLAGLRREYVGENPQVFCVASDLSTVDEAVHHGVNPLVGEVYGMAGILVGLARLKGIQGLCLLAETLGLYPDYNAARAVVEKFSAIYGIRLDLSSLAETASDVSKSVETLSL